MKGHSNASARVLHFTRVLSQKYTRFTRVSRLPYVWFVPYTKSLMQRLYERTSLIVSKVKKLHRQGGSQMVGYLQEEWAMQLSSKDKKACHQDAVEKQLRSERDSLLKENKKIQKYSNVLQNQVITLSVQLQKACSSRYKPTRGPL